MIRQPGPPVDLHHLSEVDGVDGNDDMQHGQGRELTDQRPERINLILLQGIIELIIPAVDLYQ